MKLTRVSATAGAVTNSKAGSVPATVSPAQTLSCVVAPDQVKVGALAGQVQAAHGQLASMGDMDAARVAEIKTALARGEIQFDPAKIAGLVMRHHGGR